MIEVRCNDCAGRGRIARPDATSRTVEEARSPASGMERCPRCEGTGRLRGNVTPTPATRRWLTQHPLWTR
jgi:DnaJ-class molecular chaperone